MCSPSPNPSSRSVPRRLEAQAFTYSARMSLGEARGCRSGREIGQCCLRELFRWRHGRLRWNRDHSPRMQQPVLLGRFRCLHPDTQQGIAGREKGKRCAVFSPGRSVVDVAWVGSQEYHLCVPIHILGKTKRVRRSPDPLCSRQGKSTTGAAWCRCQWCQSYPCP